MRAVVQRVAQARVRIDGDIVGEIGRGLLVLLGVTHADTPAQADWLAEKIAGLRIFPDPLTPALSPAGERVQGEGDRMNRSLADVNGGMLIVSQFTLYGDCAKGRRPSFVGAAPPAIAVPLYERFVEAAKALGVPVATGRFGAMMQVELVNDGPVTLVIDSK